MFGQMEMLISTPTTIQVKEVIINAERRIQELTREQLVSRH